MNEIDNLLKVINDDIEKPFITARFGDNWKEHQKRMLDEGQINIDMILDIAWKQGRKNILLEKYLRMTIK